MTRPQKYVFALTLLAVSLFLHTLFCNWHSGSYYTGTADYRGQRNTALVDCGYFGIVPSSKTTKVRDGLLGVALPMILMGSAVMAILAPQKTDAKKD